MDITFLIENYGITVVKVLIASLWMTAAVTIFEKLFNTKPDFEYKSLIAFCVLGAIFMQSISTSTYLRMFSSCPFIFAMLCLISGIFIIGDMALIIKFLAKIIFNATK